MKNSQSNSTEKPRKPRHKLRRRDEIVNHVIAHWVSYLAGTIGAAVIAGLKPLLVSEATLKSFAAWILAISVFLIMVVGIIIIKFIKSIPLAPASANLRPWPKLRHRITDAYRMNEIEGLFLMQTMLRYLFVLLAVGAAYAEHHRWASGDLSGAEVRVRTQFAVATFYLLLSTGFIFWFQKIYRCVQQLRAPTSSEEDTERLESTCARMAYADVATISLLAMLNFHLGAHFHVAYIIPSLGIWLADKHKKRIIWTIIIVLVIRPIALTAWPEETLPVGAPATSWRMWQSSAAAIGFWIGLSFLLLLLRILRKSDVAAKKLAEEAQQMADDRRTEAQEARLIAEQERAKAEESRRIAESARESAEKAREVAEFERCETAKARFASEHLLNCLETLGVRQKHIVFAKDKERRFTYVNSVLLDHLTPIAERIGFTGADGRRITVLSPLKLEDVVGKSDKDFQIDCWEYLRSDADALHLTAEEISKHAALIGVDADAIVRAIGIPSGSFSDFEPSLDNIKRGIWTTKHEICNAAGEVIGLVGEAVDGYPVQLQDLARQMYESLPVYALMKEWDSDLNTSRIVWSNKLHLNKIRPFLQQVCPGVDDLAIALQSIDGGRGPTDQILYEAIAGEENATLGGQGTWRQYSRDDLRLIEIARECLGPHEDPNENWEEILAIRIQHWASEAKQVSDYPNHGWVEQHRFPGSSDYRWVEVRKWPWIEPTRRHGRCIMEVRGVLVLFEDVSEGHVRRHIVWRWVKRHLRHGAIASSNYLSKRGKPQVKKDTDQKISAIPLIDLELRMLGWMKDMAEKPNAPHVSCADAKNTVELLRIIQVLEEMQFGCRVEHNIAEDSPWKLRECGQELFAIVLVLLINAGQATIRRREYEHKSPRDKDTPQTSLELIFDRERRQALVKVRDHGVGFEEDEHWRVSAGLCRGDGYSDGSPELSRFGKVLMPGGGIALLRYLLRNLWSKAEGRFIKTLPQNAFTICSAGVDRGAEAIVRIPWDAFGGSQPPAL